MSQVPSDWGVHATSLREAVTAHAPSPLRTSLDQALAAIASGDFVSAAGHGEEALALEPSCVVAWRLIGLGREGQGEGARALEAYAAANALDPQSAAILADLGRLALTLGLPGVAGEFFAKAMVIEPGSAHLAKQLGLALRDGRQHQRAKQVIGGALEKDTDNALLWNALGSVSLQEGETQAALIELDRALALAPAWPEALYNRAIAKLELADLRGAGADCDAAIELSAPEDRPAVRFVRAQVRLAQGDLRAGWEDYRARHDPNFASAPTYLLEAPRWTPATRLQGLRLLVVGEQGLGDEIMFASLLSDLSDSVGPEGKLFLAVSPRLVTLFERSFPTINVIPMSIVNANARSLVRVHLGAEEIQAWTPIGDLCAQLRVTLQSFRQDRGYLAPRPDQVRRWSETLRILGPKPKIGLTWKSLKVYGHRSKQYAPFSDWRPVLEVPEVSFVNLQYGECSPEIESAKAFGAEIWQAPGLDLTNDIEGAAALSSAVDLVIGVGNASSNLAAAVGVPTWFLFPPVAWPRLGGPGHPWFPATCGFAPESFGAWTTPLQQIADALRSRFSTGAPPRAGEG